MLARSPLVEMSGTALERDGFTLLVDHLSIKPEEVVALVGPSGCGKSTCLDLLALTQAPTLSEFFVFDGDDVKNLWIRGQKSQLQMMRAAKMGVVLQSGGLIPSLNLVENILLSRRLLHMPLEDDLPELLERLDLLGLEHRLPHQLSIGERQRVAVARALFHKPKLLLADEPTAALDPARAENVMQALSELVEVTGTALLWVSHDRSLAQRFSQRQILVTTGAPGLARIGDLG